MRIRFLNNKKFWCYSLCLEFLCACVICTLCLPGVSISLNYVCVLCLFMCNLLFFVILCVLLLLFIHVSLIYWDRDVMKLAVAKIPNMPDLSKIQALSISCICLCLVLFWFKCSTRNIKSVCTFFSYGQRLARLFLIWKKKKKRK